MNYVLFDYDAELQKICEPAEYAKLREFRNFAYFVVPHSFCSFAS